MPGSQSAVSHRRLTVAMIARDCADLVTASLDSIRNVADEIIVVDCGSRDRTREIALKNASRVLDFEWCDDFAQARNFALEHSSGDWVFWLDAGEVIQATDAQQLRALVDAQADSNLAFMVMVQTPAANQEAAAEQIGRIRLHPRRFGIEYTGRVREEIQTAVEALGISIELAPFTVMRSNRDHEPRIKRTRAERNVHLAALEIQEHGVLPAPLLAMADGCVTLGHLAEGIEFYSRALETSPRGSTAMLEAFYGLLATLDQLPKAHEKQIALCQQALEIFPLDAQLLCAMGSYLERQGRIDLASRSFEAAARFGQVDPQTTHLIEIADIAAVCQATCQRLLGDVDAARRILESAVRAKPESERLRRQLLDLYIHCDCRREAFDLVAQLPNAQHKEALRSAVRGACLAAMQNWIPALAYLQTAWGSGCRDTICFRGLASAYLATGDLTSAERTIAVWESHHPGGREVVRYAQQLERLRNATQDDAGPPEPGEIGQTKEDRRLRLDSPAHSLRPLAPKALRSPARFNADLTR